MPKRWAFDLVTTVRNLRGRDWAMTLPFLLAFGGILLVFDPLQRLARLLGQRPHEIVVGALQASLMASLRV